MKIFRVATLAVAATFAVSGCAGGDGGSSSGAPDDALDITFSYVPSSFDPPDVGDNPTSQFLQPVYDTLTQVQPDGSVGPRLATEWEYTDDALQVLRMTLRDDVTFSDGTPFDAAAVKANIEHFLTGTGPAVNNVRTIQEVVVVDPTTVELHLSEPNPALLRYLALTAGMMVSPAVLGQESLATAPVGSGPYVLSTDGTVSGSKYVYTRNPDYWAADSYPYDQITLSSIAEVTARLNAVRTGQADVSQITPKTMAEAESAGLDVTHFSSGDIMQLVLIDRGGQLSPALADPRVRQAINMAIDRESVVSAVYDGLGQPTTQLFNPSSDAWLDELADRYPYDPAAARELLAEAGYADGLTLNVPEFTGIADLFAIVAQQLGEVGITVQSTKVPDAQANTEMRSGKYPAVLQQLQSNDPWQAIQLMVMPQSAWNPLGYQEPALDELIRTAQSATGDARATAYQELNRYLVEQAWSAPLAVAETVFASEDDVTVTPYAYSVIPPIEGYAPAGS